MRQRIPRSLNSLNYARPTRARARRKLGNEADLKRIEAVQVERVLKQKQNISERVTEILNEREAIQVAPSSGFSTAGFTVGFRLAQQKAPPDFASGAK